MWPGLLQLQIKTDFSGLAKNFLLRIITKRTFSSKLQNNHAKNYASFEKNPYFFRFWNNDIPNLFKKKETVKKGSKDEL